jgi:hypothetical protein
MKFPVTYQLYKRRARILHYLHKLTNVLFKANPLQVVGCPSFYRDMLVAVQDATEYLSTDLNGFITLFDEHSRWPHELWDKVGGDVAEFNRHITGDVGRMNICANTICSFILKNTHDTLYSVLKMLGNRQQEITLCDYGCCNANVTFSMLLGGHVTSLDMYDLYSESAEFIRHRINKYGMEEQAQWRCVDEPLTGRQYDVVYCIDVLEHTETPSNILETSIAPLLKSGGYLIIQAPWGGPVVSHLDEAIIDFYTKGGREFLTRHFEEVYSMSTLDISAVWRKK